MTAIRIGTRGSRLALVQTGMVAQALHACLPDAQIETVIIKTKGDKILDKPLGDIGVCLCPNWRPLFWKGKWIWRCTAPRICL